MGLLVVGGRGGLSVGSGSWQVRSGGRVVGVVFGAVTVGEARLLVRRLRAGDDPGVVAQDLPWAVVVWRDSGVVAATCSMVLSSGLFWGVCGQGVVVATDPGGAASRLGRPAVIDGDFLRRFVVMSTDVDRSPLVGVNRLTGGETLCWRPSRFGYVVSGPRQWCGPRTVPGMSCEGDGVVADYLQVFDSVVAGLAARAGALVTTVSGGLDSTFVAASLARYAAAGSQVVSGYCYSPLSAAGVGPVGKFDPDDLPLARQLGQMYSGSLTVAPLQNVDLVHPLDAAAAVYRSGWWPVSGVANSVWMGQFARRASEHGARLRFMGVQGNAAFSDSHRYAARYYLKRMQLDRVLSLADPRMGHGLGWWSGLRSRVAGPLLRPQRPPLNPDRFPQLGVPVDHYRRPEGMSRAFFLRWLTGRFGSWSSAWNPATTGGVLAVDPFSARSVIELAAQISPRQWQVGAQDRAWARRLGKGRVPEAIRVRRRRGGQGGDAWYVACLDRDRFDAGLHALSQSSVFAGWVDVDVTVRWVESQFANTVCTDRSGTGPVGFADLLRLLAAAEYEQWVTTQHLGGGFGSGELDFRLGGVNGGIAGPVAGR